MTNARRLAQATKGGEGGMKKFFKEYGLTILSSAITAFLTAVVISVLDCM